MSLQDGTIYLVAKNRVEFIDEEISKYCISIIEKMLGDYKV